MAIKPMTPEQKTNYINTLTNYYNTLYKATGMKIPKNILDYAVTHQISTSDFRQLVVSKDKAWANGPIAKSQRQTAIEMLVTAFGNQSWKKDKELVKMVQAFGTIADPAKIGQALRTLFLQKVSKSSAFKTRNPGFDKWWKTHGASQSDQFNPNSWVSSYNSDVVTERENFQAVYAGLVSPNATMPDELFWTAFNGGWNPNDPRFVSAVQSSSAWGGSSGAQVLAQDFTENWGVIFGADVPPDPSMLAAYTKGNGNFTDFFHSAIKNSSIFRTTFPTYSDWEAKTSRSKGIPPTELDVFGYFAQQADDKDTQLSYINDYKEMFGPDATPNQAWLDRAIAEKWSVGVWHNFILKNDPSAASTEEYKNKAADFDLYWKGVFGENSTADPGLRAQYVSSGTNDPLTMWDQIKGTSAFQQQYANWDAFSSAQEAQGNVVMNDPGAYKEYQRGMEDAFSKIGMAVPQEMVRTIFASGVNPNELENNLQTFDQTKQSYDWQTGQQADLQTAAGVGNRAAGGDLRKRMEQALAQHRAYSESKFNAFDTGMKNDQLVKKI
jgi:hypothetical protein